MRRCRRRSRSTCPQQSGALYSCLYECGYGVVLLVRLPLPPPPPPYKQTLFMQLWRERQR